MKKLKLIGYFLGGLFLFVVMVYFLLKLKGFSELMVGWGIILLFIYILAKNIIPKYYYYMQVYTNKSFKELKSHLRKSLIYFLIASLIIGFFSVRILFLILLFLIFVVIPPFEIIYTRKKDEKIISFEEKQIKKGFVKFVDRSANIHWVRPNEIMNLEKRDLISKKFSSEIEDLIKDIKDFKPIQKYNLERDYQIDLTRYLKGRFLNKNIGMEIQRKGNRPDIIVGDTAIEIKGPTRHNDLKTLAHKCLMYSKYFTKLVVVLFDVQMKEEKYKSIINEINKIFPEVIVIRKDDFNIKRGENSKKWLD